MKTYLVYFHFRSLSIHSSANKLEFFLFFVVCWLDFVLLMVGFLLADNCLDYKWRLLVQDCFLHKLFIFFISLIGSTEQVASNDRITHNWIRFDKKYICIHLRKFQIPFASKSQWILSHRKSLIITVININPRNTKSYILGSNL